MGKYFDIADAELKDAARNGRAFLQWESLRQIALNLARIADYLDEKQKPEPPGKWRKHLDNYELVRRDDSV